VNIRDPSRKVPANPSSGVYSSPKYRPDGDSFSTDGIFGELFC